MRHAVLGPGGVGGLLAGALARAGEEVTVITRPGAPYPARIRVRSVVLGEFEAPVKVTDRLDEAVDVLWVTVKAGALPAALDQAPGDRVELAVIPLLNGVDHMKSLRARYGDRRVYAGTIRVEAELVAPGEIVQNGKMIALEVAGPDRRLAERIAEEVSATGMAATVQENPDLALWSKLVTLAPFALTSTASGLQLGGIDADPKWRELMLASMREVQAVAAAEGIVIGEPVRLLDVAPPTMRSSMQKDAAAGRPLEVDQIAGPVLSGGRRHGLATPATERLVALIRERHPA